MITIMCPLGDKVKEVFDGKEHEGVSFTYASSMGPQHHFNVSTEDDQAAADIANRVIKADPDLARTGGKAKPKMF